MAERDLKRTEATYVPITGSASLGKERANVSSISLVDEHKNIKQGIEAVEFMNNYYASAGFNLLNQFNTTWQPNIHLFGGYPGFKFSDIYEYEVTKLIKEIKGRGGRRG